MEIRITKNENLLNADFFWIILLMAFFEPAYFSQIHYLDLFYDVMKVISFSITAVILIKKGEYPVVNCCTILYYILIISVTYLKYGDVKTIVFQSISAVGAVTTVFLMSEYIEDRFIKCVAFVFEVLVYGNCLSVLIAPHGLYRFMTVTGWWTDACWFLGIRNGMTLTYLIGFYIEWVNFYLDRGEKTRFVIYMIVSTFSIFRINFSSSILIGAGSAGGLVICWLCILAYFVMPKKIPFLNFFSAFFLDMIFFVLLVFFRIQRIFSYFLEKYLHKTATLSGRVYLWEKALKVIKKSIIFGYGAEYGKSMALRLKTPASVSTTQNGFLDILYTGGMVLFVVFLIIIIISAILIKRHSCDVEIDTFIGYVTFVFFLCCQSESLIGVRFFFYLQILVITSAYIQKECKKHV